MALTLRASAPGFIKFRVNGTKSDYRVLAGHLPLTATVVIDSPNPTTGQCGEEYFRDIPVGNPERCLFPDPGSAVRCR